MSETLYEWLIVWTFILLVVGFTFAEAFWLNKKGWTNFGRAFVFSALTNFIGLAVGGFVLFIVTVIFIMIVFDGAVDKLPAGNVGLAAILILAALFTPIFLMLCKRVFFALLKIQTGKAAWLYSLVSSVLILIVSLGVPSLIAYFVYR